MSTKNRFFLFSGLAVLFFLGSGWLYQKSAHYLNALSDVKVMPVIPLDRFPYQVGTWQGTDSPISETVLKVAANDDYLSRYYVDSNRHLQATVYVAYTAEPRRMLGHRPRVCYVGSGWIHDGTEEQIFETSGIRRIPCLIHRFHKTDLDYQDIVVLNYYIVNGKPTSDHKSFSGLRWRRPKMENGQFDYVAQVQISSGSESSARILAEEFSYLILQHLPN